MLHYPQIEMPATAKIGDIIEVKTLIATIKDVGKPIKNKKTEEQNSAYITAFSATFNNKPIFRAHLTEEMSAHPFLSFHMKVTESGTMVLTWRENTGKVITKKHKLTAG